MGATEVSTDFGFTGPEIFPLEFDFGMMRAADVNGDGFQDLLAINNAESKITLLVNRAGKKPGKEDRKVKRELNQLPPDSRFRLESVASEKRITAFEVGDFNGDGRVDLAYYGEPKEFIIHFHGEQGWLDIRRWPIRDAQLTQNALTKGDLNGDGKVDLALLGENRIHLLIQGDSGLEEPRTLPFAEPVKAVQILDVDQDGRQDLLLVNWESVAPFRVRFQNEEGDLGAEIPLTHGPIRSYWAGNLDGDKVTDLVTIAQQSGRAELARFVQAAPNKQSAEHPRLQMLPLQHSEQSARGLVWADLNGDGRTDCLVAEPGSGQVSLYQQDAKGSMGTAQTFPCLSGVSDIQVADWDGKPGPEIFVLSPDERQIGITRLDARGALPFPVTLSGVGRPLVMTLGVFHPGKPARLAVVLERDDQRYLGLYDSSGSVHEQKLDPKFRSTPGSLVSHDLDQDGRLDLLVLTPYAPLKILRQKEDGSFEEIDLEHPAGSVDRPWATSLDVDDDGLAEIVMAQNNFLRAMVLRAQETSEGKGVPAWRLEVKEQINGASSRSRLVSAASLPAASGNKKSKGSAVRVFLLDAGNDLVSTVERGDKGVWRVVENHPLTVQGLQQVFPMNLASGGTPNALAFHGPHLVAWMPFSGPVWEIAEVSSFETPIEGGFLMDVVPGDLNGDGHQDLLFLETARNYIDLAVVQKGGQLVAADRWQVFEERTFRSRRNGNPEPREALIADFTGDGKNDLALVVHDRILLYPQD